MATKALNYKTAEINQRLNLAGTAVQPNTLSDYYTKTVVDAKVVVDLSARYNSSYASLSAALTALNADTSITKVGGMSIKFINSGSGKYEQWSLKSSSWSTNTSDWRLIVDGSITNGKLKLSSELEKPSPDTFVTKTSEIGHNDEPMDIVINSIGKNTSLLNQSFAIPNCSTKVYVNDLPVSGRGIRASDGISVEYEGYKHSDYIPVAELSSIILNTPSANTFGIAFYSSNNEESYISGIINTTGVKTIQVPIGARYFRWCSGMSRAYYAQYPIYQDLGSAVSIKTIPTLKNGYYSGTTVGATMGDFTADNSFIAAESEVLEGDIVVINGTGSSGRSRLYAFVNSSNVIVAVAAASFVAENLALAVPSTAVKVYVTSTDTSNTSVTVYSDIRKKEENDIQAVQASMSQMQTSLEPEEEITFPATNLSIQNEGIKASTGQAQSYTNYWRSDFVHVKGGSTLEIYTYPASSFGIAFYLSNNESSYISGDVNTSSVRTLTVPQNAKYFRWCSIRQGTSYYVKYIDSKSIPEQLNELKQPVAELQVNVENIIVDKYSGLDVSARAINVLLIGNSYSRDLAVYIPQMLSSIGITNYKIGIAGRSSSSIQMHAQAGDSAVYYYDSNSGNGWTTEYEKTMQYCVQKEDWDIILLQQVSFHAGYKYKNNTTTYLSTLLDTINGYLASSNNFSGSVKYGWVATPAYTTGSDDLETYGYETSEEMAKDIWKLAVYLYENYHFNFVVPTCIAIEEARETTLNQYGDYNNPHSEPYTGGIMWNDTSQHLIEGIGRQIAGYVGLMSLFGQSCMGNKARFTTQSNLQPHGSAVGSDDANSYIAQKCVVDAFKNIDF